MGLKTDDKVVMNDKYYVCTENKGKVWTVRSEPWILCGTEVVLLEGKSGGYVAVVVVERDEIKGDHVTEKSIPHSSSRKRCISG